MGSAAGCTRENDASQETWNVSRRQQVFRAHALMNAIRDDLQKGNKQDPESNEGVHTIVITEFPFHIHKSVECGDILDFQIEGIFKYDVFQVYRDGENYYRLYEHEGRPMYHGLELFGLKAGAPKHERRIILSFTLNPGQPHLDICLCVIRSSRRRKVFNQRQCPRNKCSFIQLDICERQEKITLKDEQHYRKIHLCEGDTIELERSSNRIEERKYCPISGGLYTDRLISRTPSTQENYRRKFDKYGMSFFFYFNDVDELNHVTVCIVDQKYRIKNVQITDDEISPNLIVVEQNDWIFFEWDCEHELAIEQTYPYPINQTGNIGEHFLWPYDRTCRGCMYYRFLKQGIFHYKTRNNQTGTIIVTPERRIHPVTLFDEKLVFNDINTKDFVQFHWKKTDPLPESNLVTVDSHTSVISNENNDQPGISQPCEHDCGRAYPFFRSVFLACETFIFDVPRYGLYNVIYSENPKHALVSLVVEKGNECRVVTYREETSQFHEVTQHEETNEGRVVTFHEKTKEFHEVTQHEETNEYHEITRHEKTKEYLEVTRYEKPKSESKVLHISRFDQVQFHLSLRGRRTIRICQTDKHGNPLGFEDILFQTNGNNENYFLREFTELGIYHYSIHLDNHDKFKSRKSSTVALTILVRPEIRFHWKLIRQKIFDSRVIITTNSKDFVIWEFEKAICHNVVHLGQNETFDQLLSCDRHAIVGRNRKCLAVYCKDLPLGASFFANPDFQWVTDVYDERLISTVIVDPPFNQYSFLITQRQFIPDILYIPETETVSWKSTDTTRNHQLSVKLMDDADRVHEDNLFDDNIAPALRGIHYVHTFNRPGRYEIRSNGFENAATVVVYSETVSRRNRVKKPIIKEKIEPITELGARVHIECPDLSTANFYYTFDGLPPTQQDDNVYTYDPDEGIPFIRAGLQVLRCYGTADGKVASSIIYTRPTFVMGNDEFGPLWRRIRIVLLASHKRPTLIYGKINIKPTYALELIDHFTLHTNDHTERLIQLGKRLEFSVHVTPPANQSEIYVTAHPKTYLTDARPILSYKLTFKFQADGISPRPPGPEPLARPRTPSPPLPSPDDDVPNRAKGLLDSLIKSIKERRRRQKLKDIHPHTVYPGMVHYINNQSGLQSLDN